MHQKIKRFLLDLLFPAFCLGCKKEGTYLCQDCKATLEILEKRYCLCDESPTLLLKQARDGRCQKCRSKNLSGLYFALYFKERALTRKLLCFFLNEPHYLKDLAKTLSLLIFDHFSLAEIDAKELFADSLIMPIAKNDKETRTRGYNPSEEIAKELSLLLNTPVAQNSTIIGKRIFLIDSLYKPDIMEGLAKELKDNGAKEVWGITVARE